MLYAVYNNYSSEKILYLIYFFECRIKTRPVSVTLLIIMFSILYQKGKATDQSDMIKNMFLIIYVSLFYIIFNPHAFEWFIS